jgi:hypothetical protein
MIKQFPHCDQFVLHPKGACMYCDKHPLWQELRDAWGINCTGENNPLKLPCPSEVRRSLETINKWGGNRAITKDEMLVLEIMES